MVNLVRSGKETATAIFRKCRGSLPPPSPLGNLRLQTCRAGHIRLTAPGSNVSAMRHLSRSRKWQTQESDDRGGARRRYWRLGGAVAQGNGPEGGPGMRGGMMQGGMGPGGMGPGGMGGMGPGGMMQGRGMMDPSARVEQRLTRLKGEPS